MISVTSVTDKYSLQPALIGRHRKTLEWLSAAVLWKRELRFFQKILQQYAGKFVKPEDKKMVDHFQSLIIYYNTEVIDNMTSLLRMHERKLAESLEKHDETDIQYYREHDELMTNMESLNNQFMQYKEELYHFVEKVM